jgi:hypothetical protein
MYGSKIDGALRLVTLAPGRKRSIFQRDGLRKSMIVSEKIHFLYTTFLHFVKIERLIAMG